MEKISSLPLRQIPTAKSSKEWIKKIDIKAACVFEISWEVCNQLGGIYTVLRSKAPAMKSRWRDNHVLIGPYIEGANVPEFEEDSEAEGEIVSVISKLRELGVEVVTGRWLVTGRPRVVLINPRSAWPRLGEIKRELWLNHGIVTPVDDNLIHNVIAFGNLVHLFFKELDKVNNGAKKIIAHFHEWMGAATAIPEIRRENLDVKTVFTTHATQLGRYCALAYDNFYTSLSSLDWEAEADRFTVRSKVDIERAATHGAHVFTAVSDVVANECEVFLGRRPDFITPNGLNIERYAAVHDFQNLHKIYKDSIHRFTVGHFFPSYSFDLDKTLYFFTAGRYEFKNKGFDVVMDGLAKLNKKLIESNSDITVVMFFITRTDSYSINPQVLQSRALLDEIHRISNAIQSEVGDGLFKTVSSNKEIGFPDLNSFVDEYWLLRLKRTLYSWKSKKLPLIVTHTLTDDKNDQILNAMRKHQLFNGPQDRVKVVYHPEFITSESPLFGMDYDHFVRGCHLGVFPSYYEPWGYTPLECIARGVPTVTTNLSGFGEYAAKELSNLDKKGVYIINRKRDDKEAISDDLAEVMYKFTKKSMRERVAERNRCESMSEGFDWINLVKHYDEAYYNLIKRNH